MPVIGEVGVPQPAEQRRQRPQLPCVLRAQRLQALQDGLGQRTDRRVGHVPGGSQRVTLLETPVSRLDFTPQILPGYQVQTLLAEIHTHGVGLAQEVDRRVASSIPSSP